ncbi:hypothetical protein ACIBI4_31585 [Streptomyces sp. NPDC050418]|uniref:hypothetical protein n=1 Tax=Streptomyces sp. NPDC050418 TaxID=3365612 RepID=UPI0037BA2077
MANESMHPPHSTGDGLPTGPSRRSPGWYYPGLGASLALAFVCVDLGGSLVPAGPIVGAVLAPSLLTWAASRDKGPAVTEALSATGSRTVFGLYLVLLGLVTAVGLGLGLGAGLTGAASAAGLAALVLTMVLGRWADNKKPSQALA